MIEQFVTHCNSLWLASPSPLQYFHCCPLNDIGSMKSRGHNYFSPAIVATTNTGYTSDMLFYVKLYVHAAFGATIRESSSKTTSSAILSIDEITWSYTD